MVRRIFFRKLIEKHITVIVKVSVGVWTLVAYRLQNHAKIDLTFERWAFNEYKILNNIEQYDREGNGT